jgi:drug/metabolite transporter (DMT)-like permease
MSSIQLACVTLILWTTWALMMDKASDGFGGFYTSMVVISVQFVMSMCVGIYVIVNGGRSEVNYPITWWLYAVLAGASGVVALWTFTAALNRGPLMPVLIISGLYPVMAALLSSIINKERLSWTLCLATICMALAVILVFFKIYSVAPIDNGN